MDELRKTFHQEVDAIQWYETYGEIEFVNRQERSNETFENIVMPFRML